MIKLKPSAHQLLEVQRRKEQDARNKLRLAHYRYRRALYAIGRRFTNQNTGG